MMQIDRYRVDVYSYGTRVLSSYVSSRYEAEKRKADLRKQYGGAGHAVNVNHEQFKWPDNKFSGGPNG